MSRRREAYGSSSSESPASASASASGRSTAAASGSRRRSARGSRRRRRRHRGGGGGGEGGGPGLPTPMTNRIAPVVRRSGKRGRVRRRRGRGGRRARRCAFARHERARQRRRRCGRQQRWRQRRRARHVCAAADGQPLRRLRVALVVVVVVAGADAAIVPLTAVGGVTRSKSIVDLSKLQPTPLAARACTAGSVHGRAPTCMHAAAACGHVTLEAAEPIWGLLSRSAHHPPAAVSLGEHPPSPVLPCSQPLLALSHSAAIGTDTHLSDLYGTCLQSFSAHTLAEVTDDEVRFGADSVDCLRPLSPVDSRSARNAATARTAAGGTAGGGGGGGSGGGGDGGGGGGGGVGGN